MNESDDKFFDNVLDEIPEFIEEKTTEFKASEFFTSETDRLPDVCFTCAKPIGIFQSQVQKYLNQGLRLEQIMDILGLTKICCRTRFLSPIKIPISANTIHQRNAIDNFLSTTDLYYGLPRNEDEVIAINGRKIVNSAFSSYKINMVDIERIYT